MIAVHIMSWYLTCPKCAEQGASGINNRRSIFSPSQRVYKQVVLKNGNVNQNCCKKCNKDYYLAEPDKCYETVRILTGVHTGTVGTTISKVIARTRWRAAMIKVEFPLQEPTQSEYFKLTDLMVVDAPSRQQPSNQAYAPSPRPPMRNPSQPSPSAIFVPEVSDEEFTIHWLACKALFPAPFWKFFHERLLNSTQSDRGKALDSWL